MNHRERVAQLAAADKRILDSFEPEDYRVLASLLIEQLAWARDKMERGEKLCKDPWDRAHLRTVKMALVLDHPKIIKHKELIMSLTHVPTDAASRKALPICRGVLDYFPDALLAVAAVSKAGNDQHNPGQPLHWAKEKSTDEADALLRHLIDRGKLDVDGLRHSAKAAWRALALLQREIDADSIVSLIPPKYRDLTEEDRLQQGDEYRAPGSDEWKPICQDTNDFPVSDCARGFSYRRKVGVAPVSEQTSKTVLAKGPYSTVRQIRRAPSDKFRYLEDGEKVRKGDEVSFLANQWEPAAGLTGERVNGQYKFKARRPRAEEASDVK